MDETLPSIVGLGARTAVGRSMVSSAAAVRASVAHFIEHPTLTDATGRPMVVAMAGWLPDAIEGVDRFAALGVNAAKEALRPLLRIPGVTPPPLKVFVGLPEDRPGRPEDLDGAIAERLRGALRKWGAAGEVVIPARGNASGLVALEQCAREIREGKAEACLVGGIDSYLDGEALEWLDERGQLHSRSNKWGFIPGEGAGFLLVVSARLAGRLGLRVLGRVVSAASTREENRIKTETVCTGAGLTAAFRGALGALEGASVKVAEVFCDLNGEPYRADELAFTLVRTSKSFVEPGRFRAPADCWGDVGAASGALFVGLALEAARRGYARGACSLVWASSEGGDRAAAVVYQEPAPRERVT